LTKIAPVNNSIFIYIQVVHVTSISTTEQTFHAKFYIRATWVQELCDNELIKLKPGVKPIEAQTDWPKDVFMPSVAFDNAKEEIEYKGQTVGVSPWRKVINQPERDNFVVVEWKAKGCGVFFQKFELGNFPCDIQLLKIVISSLAGASLHDDDRDGVMSNIRKDYFVDQGFVFKFELEAQTQSGETETSRGAKIKSLEEILTINAREFHTLTYLIPAKRIDHHAKREILHPVTLITLAAMFSFLFPPDAPNDRLTVSITIALVMTGYLYVITNYLPRTTETHLFDWYVSFSYWFVFLVALQNTVIAIIACEGKYCGLDYDSASALSQTPSESSVAQIADVVFLGIFACVWFFVNAYVYVMVYYKMKIKEEKRIRKYLNPTGDRTTEVSLLIEKK